MKSSLLSRAALPVLAFVAAFACTSGLTLWAAEPKAGRKTERKAPAKPEAATTEPAEKRPP
ncbi:MAG: hypothetical protein FJ399_21335, partial [Verrucomicrobia bacterium]|nr:hypothetical protein [Verrucomicrobiota bacterium]